jgi:hypothetical protein
MTFFYRELYSDFAGRNYHWSHCHQVGQTMFRTAEHSLAICDLCTFTDRLKVMVTAAGSFVGWACSKYKFEPEVRINKSLSAKFDLESQLPGSPKRESQSCTPASGEIAVLVQFAKKKTFILSGHCVPCGNGEVGWHCRPLLVFFPCTEPVWY